MEENEYRATYDQFNQTRCAFEKAILSRRCNCEHSHKFCLAEREGIACQAVASQQQCQELLLHARQKAIFALKLTQASDILPHAKEIRVQLGCLTGLAGLLDGTEPETITDANDIVTRAKQTYGDWQALPFETLVRSIMHFQGRQRSRNKPTQ